MIPRLLALVLALTLVAGVVTGCTPEPAPSPTATGFATEEEAFAAAEETYRAYVDALNQVDLSDPETFEAVYAWTTGEANAGARKSYTQMHADGWDISGQSKITLVEPSPDLSLTPVSIQAFVCLDVSEIAGVDGEGNSVVSEDRRDIQPMLIGFESADSDTGLLVSNIDGRDGAPECG